MAENPQPPGGAPFHLVIDFFVGDKFAGESIEVSLDSELIVDGIGHANPEAHCNWYGPYLLMLDSGIHEIEVTTGDGLSFTESFELTAESHGIILYRHPSSDPGELDKAELRWFPSDGPPGCA